jgi:hypothetical protein
MGRAAPAEAAQEAGQHQLPERVAAGDVLKRDVATSDGLLAINEPYEPESSVCLFRETDLIEEQRFLIDWERGLVTELCHYVRVRQIYRAGVLPVKSHAILTL